MPALSATELRVLRAHLQSPMFPITIRRPIHRPGLAQIEEESERPILPRLYVHIHLGKGPDDRLLPL